jgi:hypothetical protein
VFDADALERALEGLAPEQITGRGGLITQLTALIIRAVVASLRRPPCSLSPNSVAS